MSTPNTTECHTALTLIEHLLLPSLHAPAGDDWLPERLALPLREVDFGPLDPGLTQALSGQAALHAGAGEHALQIEAEVGAGSGGWGVEAARPAAQDEDVGV